MGKMHEATEAAKDETRISLDRGRETTKLTPVIKNSFFLFFFFGKSIRNNGAAATLLISISTYGKSIIFRGDLNALLTLSS